MPKTNVNGATYAGNDGIVEDAVGRLSQLDPSRNLDGSVVDGFESDEREIEADDVQEKDLRADSTTVTPITEDDDASEDEPAEAVKSSVGNSSTTSSQSNAKTSAKTQSRIR